MIGPCLILIRLGFRLPDGDCLQLKHKRSSVLDQYPTSDVGHEWWDTSLYSTKSYGKISLSHFFHKPLIPFTCGTPLRGATSPISH